MEESAQVLLLVILVVLGLFQVVVTESQLEAQAELAVPLVEQAEEVPTVTMPQVLEVVVLTQRVVAEEQALQSDQVVVLQTFQLADGPQVVDTVLVKETTPTTTTDQPTVVMVAVVAVVAVLFKQTTQCLAEEQDLVVARCLLGTHRLSKDN